MKAEKIIWGVVIVAFLVGLVGIFQRFTLGHTAAAYNTYVPWGLWVAAYAALIGMSAGAFLIVILSYGFRVKMFRSMGQVALLTALAALIGGLLAIWVDLGHPFRFLNLFLSTGTTSVMGWMSWLYIIYGLILVALIFLVRQNPDSPTVRTLSLIGLPLVIVFGGAEGSLFGVVGAQALWESGLTPIMFLVEGALSGVALVVFLTTIFEKLDYQAKPVIRWLVVGLLATVVVFLWAEFSTGLYAGVPAKAESLRTILYGPYWWVFWIVHLGLGILVPLVLLVFLGDKVASIMVATGLIALTAISAKLNLIIPALVVPGLEGLRTAYIGLGLTFDYVPTLTEWLVTIWVVSLSGLVFLLGKKFLFAPK